MAWWDWRAFRASRRPLFARRSGDGVVECGPPPFRAPRQAVHSAVSVVAHRARFAKIAGNAFWDFRLGRSRGSRVPAGLSRGSHRPETRSEEAPEVLKGHPRRGTARRSSPERVRIIFCHMKKMGLANKPARPAAETLRAQPDTSCRARPADPPSSCACEVALHAGTRSSAQQRCTLLPRG